MIYEKSTELEKFSKILVIVCGGATATIDQILKWSELAT
jgi:L-serine/L-threonine ammonia-lyase